MSCVMNIYICKKRISQGVIVMNIWRAPDYFAKLIKSQFKKKGFF